MKIFNCLMVLFVAIPTFADTGFLPIQYAGKCDPWPGDRPLPNDQLLDCYVQRYGQQPGSSGTRSGYCCELFGLNYSALESACRAGEFGPGHDCVATTTEATDSSFVNERGGAFIGHWYVASLEGGSAENPHVTHDSLIPCGPSSQPGVLLGSYPLFVRNDPPCGGSPPPAAPLCPNGKEDPGETCMSCPADVGRCPAPPCMPVREELGILGDILVHMTPSSAKSRLRKELLPLLREMDRYCPIDGGRRLL